MTYGLNDDDALRELIRRSLGIGDEAAIEIRRRAGQAVIEADVVRALEGGGLSTMALARLTGHTVPKVSEALDALCARHLAKFWWKDEPHPQRRIYGLTDAGHKFAALAFSGDGD